ncbi:MULTISPECIES: Ig-like domain-containing protein [unclassified Ruminococcus]|uniref:Ig-like domain-containing protein n=1 Tax=unclassified Ruminococcus TaxID=2608920 RepID=UPI00210882E9|nr:MULTISPECIES: Ig-like domain-containing protein [unclassified Ruminococcus]MCQ4023102.1 hypothetical protein [Ruminococcus sp. zg-924]MCQ4115539.1 hypothetical protein [Ruminococcus sp. zg-921]
MIKKTKKITFAVCCAVLCAIIAVSTIYASAASDNKLTVVTDELENYDGIAATTPTYEVSGVNYTGVVKISRATLTLGVGEDFTLSAGITQTNNANQTVTWSSSSKSVATVDTNGKVYAVKPGTTVITASLANGSKSECTVTVKKAPTKLSLNKTSLTLGIGEQYDLNSSLKSDEGAYSIVYSSNNSSVASVKAAGGFVTAKKVGTATITATTYNGKKVTCKVTVKKAPTKVSLNKTSLTLGIGEQYDLNSSLKSGEGAYSIVYSSDNSSVASVKAAGGLVTANKVGTATITATAYNGKKVTCKVTVKKAPTKVSLNKTSLNLTLGEQFDLNSSLKSGEAARSIVYTSNNSAVASVKAAGGLVTANKEGTATITATAYNGVKVTCKVTVSARSYTDDDLYCLAAVIWQESGSYWLSDRCQLMVGNVVLNRVASSRFPNTIRGCLQSPGQYGPMAWNISIPSGSNSIEKKAIERCFKNAKKLLEGHRELPSNVVFQANFPQGSGTYAYEGGLYFCYL